VRRRVLFLTAPVIVLVAALMDVWSLSACTRASAERTGADLPRTVRLDPARSFMDVPLAYGHAATRQETEVWVEMFQSRHGPRSTVLGA
jgi:hypothetical protein